MRRAFEAVEDFISCYNLILWALFGASPLPTCSFYFLKKSQGHFNFVRHSLLEIHPFILGSAMLRCTLLLCTAAILCICQQDITYTSRDNSTSNNPWKALTPARQINNLSIPLLSSKDKVLPLSRQPRLCAVSQREGLDKRTTDNPDALDGPCDEDKEPDRYLKDSSRFSSFIVFNAQHCI